MPVTPTMTPHDALVLLEDLTGRIQLINDNGQRIGLTRAEQVAIQQALAILKTVVDAAEDAAVAKDSRDSE